MNILITGASGYIGKYLSDYLFKKEEFNLSFINRKRHKGIDYKPNTFFLDINEKNIDWDKYLAKIDIVIHLAATQHKIKNYKNIDSYYITNSTSVGKLISYCIKNNIKKFIYLSSIKVNGELTKNRGVFTNKSNPSPQDLYAKSKFEAEQKLLEISNTTNLEVVIIGPISNPKLATHPSTTCRCLFFKSDSKPASNNKPTFCCLTGCRNTSPAAKRFKL